MNPADPQNSVQANGQGDYTQNQDYLRKVDHDTDMAGLRNRLDKLEERVGTNEKFASTFKDAAGTQTPIQDAVEASTIKLLQHNTDAQAAVGTVVTGIDGRETKKQLWGLGKIILWVTTLVVATIVGAYINSKFK